MIKLDNSHGTNINVMADDQLTQVVGGHRGGHRRRKYNHCYDKRNYDYCGDKYGYESHCDSYDYDYCKDESYDYCERKYS